MCVCLFVPAWSPPEKTLGYFNLIVCVHQAIMHKKKQILLATIIIFHFVPIFCLLNRIPKCGRGVGSRPGITLHMNDPYAAADQIAASIPPTESIDIFVDSFLQSFSSKIAGAILGNLIAGFVFQYVSSLFQKAAQPTQPSALEPESGSTTKSSILGKLSKLEFGAWVKLVACILIDLVGDSSFILPGIGEVEDVVWAPISSFLMLQLFESNVVAGLEFAKEILPFTDIIPLATCVWVLENLLPDSSIFGLFGMRERQK